MTRYCRHLPLGNNVLSSYRNCLVQANLLHVYLLGRVDQAMIASRLTPWSHRPLTSGTLQLVLSAMLLSMSTLPVIECVVIGEDKRCNRLLDYHNQFQSSNKTASLRVENKLHQYIIS